MSALLARTGKNLHGGNSGFWGKRSEKGFLTFLKDLFPSFIIHANPFWRYNYERTRLHMRLRTIILQVYVI